MTPFDRISMYSTQTDRGVTVDTEAMMVDLITVFKAGGYGLDHLIEAINEFWPKVKVEINIPKQAKN